MYVRTKDKIVMVNKERRNYHFNDKFGFYYTGYDGINYYDIEPKEILEELCDKFVTLSKYSNRHYEYLTLKGAINMRKNLPFEVCEIYGAIWTDKGLIYVAKMNDKGELELI